jgi:hypothetical protein
MTKSFILGLKTVLQAVQMAIEENESLDSALGRILLPSLNEEESAILQSIIQDAFGTKPKALTASLEDALSNFSGVIVMGPPGSGKTTAIKKSAKQIPIEIICPLAMETEKLFGVLQRGVWHDGVVTNALRRGNTWLLFDGPLEPWWAEVLHSALDDSPKLNLVSGEALRVGPEVKIIFETQDIAKVT